MEEFPKRFEKEKEKEIFLLWEKTKSFSPDTSSNTKTFTVVIPPPNITGSLHMGHALNAVCQDIMVRYKRMKGYKTLWVPGIDHAGIATQNVVEKELIKKEGKTRHDLGREEFIKRVWEWKKKYGEKILNQFKMLGASCDYSKTVFTLDRNYQIAVKNAFLKYYKKGLIYRGERIINWCPKCETALSDIELEYKEEKSFLWYIKYPLKGQGKYITIATTRPETMLGDTALAVNPNDSRYKKLIGQTAIVPLVERGIPIISDDSVDISFGTGVLKITPAHDLLDFEIGQRHKLPAIKVINEKGLIIRPKKYANLKIKEARETIEKELKNKNYLIKKEPYIHEVPHCYRCGSTIEPMLSKQWFLKMEPLTKRAISVVENNEIQFVPKRYKKVYLEWIKNIKDWCISRQIWWGHRIPLKGEKDVLDTWFSSALWPFAALGWMGEKRKDSKNKNLKEFYPTDYLFTAKDIIYLWVARMIFSSLFFLNKIPFKKVYIHPTILNPEGKRMSKSLGTGVDPIKLWEEYGADGVRFGLALKASFRQEIRFKEEDCLFGRNFATKIWNASRFIFLNLDQKIEMPSLEEIKKINLNKSQKRTLKLLAQASKKIEKSIKEFKFDLASKEAFKFFWHHFCDKSIEQNKPLLKNKDKISQKFLVFVLVESLKLLHPFMPFVTEACFGKLSQKIKLKDNKPLALQSWPQF